MENVIEMEGWEFAQKWGENEKYRAVMEWGMGVVKRVQSDGLENLHSFYCNEDAQLWAEWSYFKDNFWNFSKSWFEENLPVGQVVVILSTDEIPLTKFMKLNEREVVYWNFEYGNLVGMEVIPWVEFVEKEYFSLISYYDDWEEEDYEGWIWNIGKKYPGERNEEVEREIEGNVDYEYWMDKVEKYCIWG